MTESELKLLRARCATTAAETVLKLAVREGRRRDRNFPLRLPTMDEWQTAGQGIAFPALDPVYSELYAGEAREAVTALLERMRQW